VADAVKRVRIIRRHEYLIDHATYAAEVGKAISMAIQDWKAVNPPDATLYDDVIHVEGHDDGVLVWWQEVDPKI
jgi:hypothetical protein